MTSSLSTARSGRRSHGQMSNAAETRRQTLVSKLAQNVRAALLLFLLTRTLQAEDTRPPNLSILQVKDFKRKMFLFRLFLWALFLSLVRGNAVTTEAGSELQNRNETTDENWNGDTPDTGRTTSASPFQREDQTPIPTQPPDQDRIPGQNATEEAASLSATATPGKTEPSTFDTSSITTADEGLTTEQETQSTTSATRVHNIYWEDDKKRFEYDYYTLRVQGLICALILFVLGILILTCGRCRNVSCCRKRKSRRAFDEMTRL